MIRCIGSTTYKEYRNYFEKDRALVRRFQKIDVNEPTIEDSIKILRGLKPYYERHHKVRYTAEAIKAAVELSHRYIGDRKLPDKAIDVIDETGAAQMLVPENSRRKTITAKEVEACIATMARIPPKSVSRDDREVLKNLDRDLKTMVFGQDPAIEALVSAIKLARAGLRDPEKPIGSYLFSGPTGVGKTEVARQLARTMGIEITRFDMSEYMERHTVSRLIGAPPGYVGFDQGGLLTDAIDQHPHSVLLLDEIEKAHPDLFNILLQVMDYGKLTDHNGKTVDFRNVILIMTTNAGASDLAKPAIGFGSGIREGDDQEAINRMFTPEFRNRLDAVISFAALSPETIGRVVDKFVLQLEEQLADRNVTIELDVERARLARRKGLRPAVRRASAGAGSSRSTSRSRSPRSCCSAGWPRAASSASAKTPDDDKLAFEFAPPPAATKPEAEPQEPELVMVPLLPVRSMPPPCGLGSRRRSLDASHVPAREFRHSGCDTGVAGAVCIGLHSFPHASSPSPCRNGRDTRRGARSFRSTISRSRARNARPRGGSRGRGSSGRYRSAPAGSRAGTCAGPGRRPRRASARGRSRTRSRGNSSTRNAGSGSRRSSPSCGRRSCRGRGG